MISVSVSSVAIAVLIASPDIEIFLSVIFSISCFAEIAFSLSIVTVKLA